ncbi:MAG: biopolymer transporter ExbD [Bacteroidetes bacterium]|nr:biopolymer transporter ExbD [Bacteroidota bacterium]
MPHIKRKKKPDPEIPSASMADIAFLLLIFFMVTTTIDVDTGIGLVLPPPPTDEPPPPVKARNIMNILVNSAGQVLVNNEESSIAQIREIAKKHITNRGADPNFSEGPDKALISVKVDRETSYNIFMDVYDELNIAYSEIRDAEARSKFGTTFEKLGDDQKKQITAIYGKKISFAEPERVK